MAEKNLNKKRYFEILRELFLGKEAALPRRQKTWHALYEIDLKKDYGLPAKEMDPAARKYFEKRFLGGISIDKADKETFEKAYMRLSYAAKSGCQSRCMRLIKELNTVCEAENIQPIKDPEKFLDWLTFYSTTPVGMDGEPCKEPGYDFMIRIFHDGQNFKNFKVEVEALIKGERMISMNDVQRIIYFKQRISK